MTHRKLHVDTLILIPTFKIYVFSYFRQTDRQTDEQTEKLIWCGLGNLIGSSRSIIHPLHVGWRNFFSIVLEKFLQPINAPRVYGT